MSGLTPVRNPAGHPSAAEQDQWIFQGACLSPDVLAVQPLEAEDEFERARR
jgi:hypothetical protein